MGGSGGMPEFIVLYTTRYSKYIYRDIYISSLLSGTFAVLSEYSQDQLTVLDYFRLLLSVCPG